MSKQLLVLGCSQTKRDCKGVLPAIDRYDGSPYRVLRSFLRENEWPRGVSVAVLSAKHGLFGGLKQIEDYDQRMTPDIAAAQAPECCETLRTWAGTHGRIFLSLGKDYLPALQEAIDALGDRTTVFEGQIGEKLHQVKDLLDSTKPTPRRCADLESGTGRMTYFLPDWDDLLDPDFDFENDEFSGDSREERNDKHCCILMQPKKMCDGVLVSLAQHGTSKGPLRRLEGTEAGSLAPLSLRSQFGLKRNQWLFGDCGAFSYVNEKRPTITVEQAVALYDLYGFDFGASVDHIPVPFVVRDGKKVALSPQERAARVRTTRKNAEAFIEEANSRRVGFNPVGIIQALTPQAYAKTLQQYCEMGYRHLALGGLVPMSDDDIAAIVRAVSKAADERRDRPWIHLFGVFRPKLQELFRELRIDSFDSATYFRKAWLRSDQNYLATNGTWYAALRVPMTSDGRTRKRLEEGEVELKQLEREEKRVLRLLAKYDRDQAKLSEVLEAVIEYDAHLTRTSESTSMRDKYRRTLKDRPWRSCDCPFCQDLGIHIAVFRGSNRNKRRGAHNTLMLYRRMRGIL